MEVKYLSLVGDLMHKVLMKMCTESLLGLANTFISAQQIRIVNTYTYKVVPQQWNWLCTESQHLSICAHNNTEWYHYNVPQTNTLLLCMYSGNNSLKQSKTGIKPNVIMWLCIKQKIEKVLQLVFLFFSGGRQESPRDEQTSFFFLIQCTFILGKKKNWKRINGRGRKWKSNEK